MPRRTRVTPSGELIAVPERGMFLGFRGNIHDDQGNVVRFSRGKAWAICALEFKGRRRRLWAPGRLTELFFLDEATGLAAGHRPCGECRYRAYASFKRAWNQTHPGEPSGAPAIDAGLHADRLREPGVRRTFTAEASELPDGAMAEIDGQYWLAFGGQLLAWSPGGYGERRPARGPVTVITPRATVAVLAAGYRPIVHTSAAEPDSNEAPAS
jgi:hypothetical protein